MFNDPATAALIAWLISMTTRQSGHFFFEPLGYDEVNQATHEYKESIKVGYNLARKRILMGAWFLLPAALWFAPDLLPFVEPYDSVGSGLPPSVGPGSGWASWPWSFVWRS